MTDDRRDPSDFTGGTDKKDTETGTEEYDETTETSDTTTEDEVEESGKMLEPGEDDGPNGPYWTLKGKIEGILSRGSDEDTEHAAVAGDEDSYTEEDDYAEEDYDDEGGVNRRWFLYAIGGLGALGAGTIAADGADGEVDGEFDAFDGFLGAAPPGNETQTPQDTPDGVVTEDQTPIDAPQDTPETTPEPQQTPGQTPEAQDDIYFANLNELPDEACYRSEGGVSGYFDASEIENVLGSQAIEGLNPAQGDIAYDVDFRDADGDGRPDSYVVQLAGTDSQNDLTAAQAETLFEELDVDGSYC